MIWYLPNLLLILLIGWRLKPNHKLRSIYWTGFFLKMLAGIAVGYIYFAEIGSGDTIGFHQQATEAYQLFRHSFIDYWNYLITAHHPVYMSEARNELFVKIISVFYLASGGDYWICSLYLSLVSFFGAWYFVRSVHLLYPKLFIAAVFCFLFLPTAVFWSSGVLKDSLVNAGIFFLAGICIRYHKNHTFRWWEIFFSFGALILLFYLKYYLMAVVVLILGCLIWSKILRLISANAWKKAAFTVLAVVVLGYLTSRLHWNLNFSHLPAAVYTNYELIQENSASDNTLEFADLRPGWSSLIFHMPFSLMAGLFRPLPGEGSLFNLVHGLENVLLIMLGIVNLYFFRTIRINLPGWLTILYIIILATFLPLASPNFGTLIRYKASYLPFLVFLFSVVPLLKSGFSGKKSTPQNHTP